MSKTVLIGFMGAGKSTAARSLASDWEAVSVDADERVAERLGQSIPQVFAEQGEAVFRAVEERVTLELLDDPRIAVLALGGGAVTSEPVRRALSMHRVVWLDVDPDTAWQRVSVEGDRPLARDRAEFTHMHATRERIYRPLADVIVPAARGAQLNEVLAATQGMPPATKVMWAASASGDYPVFLGRGLLTAERFWPAGVGGRRFLVTDGRAGQLYAGLMQPLESRVVIMPGEQSKTIAHAEIVWTELVRAGMTRSDVVVALGGGVVGDLAGFCAATFQRGVRYVQVPTTLVAQVDAALGGKTGVDLSEAKNYVGVYHQPSAVLADPETLATLPGPELAAGYAEVLKTALIAGGELWDRVSGGAAPDDADVIQACQLTKLRIVAADERDAGQRQVLNLGHTVGHAIETATGYARFRHGEAVGLGLLAALRLSGLDELRARVAALLAAHGLPVKFTGAVDADTIVMTTARDKKRTRDGPVPFVLLEGPGEVRYGCPVGTRELIAAVRELAG